MPERSSVPLIPLHQPDELMLRIEALRDTATDAGLGTLAYLLDVAMLEAKRVSDQARLDALVAETDPNDLSLPRRLPWGG